MEKIIGCFALGALIVFSSHAFALEEVLVTGTQRSVDLGNPNYNNQPAAPSYNGVGVLPPEYKQGMASQDQSKARSMEEARKYCEANGYPANVPICAGFKEAKEKCDKANTYIPIEQTECRASAKAVGTNFSVATCSSETASGSFKNEFYFDGKQFDSASTYPEGSYTNGAGCRQLAAAAIEYHQSFCTTNGDRQKATACAGQ